MGDDIKTTSHILTIDRVKGDRFPEPRFRFPWYKYNRLQVYEVQQAALWVGAKHSESQFLVDARAYSPNASPLQVYSTYLQSAVSKYYKQ